MPAPLNIAVFCASSTKVDPAYLDVAYATGREIARRGHTLVWGGGLVGMMGRVAQGAQSAQGRVVGIIPSFMADTEVAYVGADELIVTPDMRSRKATIEARSDAYLVLPGGIGTLDEMFEALTQRVLQRHHKPMVLLNHAGFYDPLLAFLDRLGHERFMRPVSRTHYQPAPTPAAALDALEQALATPSLTGGGRGLG